MAKLLDPVCGMTVDDTALRAPGYDDVAFCAPGCRKTFVDNPDAYQARLDGAKPMPKMRTCGEHEGEICQCGTDHDGHGHEDHGHEEHNHSDHEVKADAGDSGCCGGNGDHGHTDHSENSPEPVASSSGCCG